MKLKAVGAVAMMSVGLLGVSTMAHALTTETRVVSEFGYVDPVTGYWVMVGSGWYMGSLGTGGAEIGSAYRAPTGFGRDALMLDTPEAGDVVAVGASLPLDRPTAEAAFSQSLTVAEIEDLGFWLYLSPASAPGSSPHLVGTITMQNNRVSIAFFPTDNGYTERGVWMCVDATAEDATWWTKWEYAYYGERLSWDQIAQATVRDYDNDGTLDDKGRLSQLQFTQDDPGGFSAVDGVTVRTADWEAFTDFELITTSARPQLDDCKDGGWSDNYPTGMFKNQGACIAAIVAAN